MAKNKYTKKSVNGQNSKCDKSSRTSTKGRSSASDPRTTDNKGFDLHKANDVSWYAQSEQLLKDAASLAFSHPLGTTLDFNAVPDYINPGIMSISLTPSVGCGKEATDAPTVAARYIYSYVRHANSGSANYEAPDLYMYILAWCSAASALEWAKRAYGTMFNYTTMNKYYVDTMVTAMGFNPQSIRSNMPGFRAAINLATSRLNSLKIPAGMPLLERWRWIYAHYWVDDPGSKAQTYVFVPHHFLKWDGYGTETGTQLVPVYACTNQNKPFTVESFTALMNELLDPLVSEEDCGIMSGDIIKAFGSDLATLALIDENFLALPEYSEEVLAQVHNLFTPVSRPNNNPHSITQSNGVIQETLEYSINTVEVQTVPNYFDEYIIDMYHDSVTPGEVMVATRLTGLYFDYDEDTQKASAVSSGSEIPTCMYIWNAPISQGTDLDLTYGDLVGDEGAYGYTTSNRGNAASIRGIRAIAGMSAFNWHPRMILETEVDGVRQAVAPLGDLENYTIVSRDFIRRLNKVAILSECATTAHTKIG